MRAVIQRVSKASVEIDGKVKSSISAGLLVLLAVSDSDSEDTVKWMCNKLVNLRIFPDNEDKMNLSVLDTGGSIMLISNFTLYGELKKGFRPNFMKAGRPEISEPLYDLMARYLGQNYPIKVETGEFGAMMKIELINDGPVTIIIDKE